MLERERKIPSVTKDKNVKVTVHTEVQLHSNFDVNGKVCAVLLLSYCHTNHIGEQE